MFAYLTWLVPIVQEVDYRKSMGIVRSWWVAYLNLILLANSLGLCYNECPSVIVQINNIFLLNIFGNKFLPVIMELKGHMYFNFLIVKFQNKVKNLHSTFKVLFKIT